MVECERLEARVLFSAAAHTAVQRVVSHGIAASAPTLAAPSSLTVANVQSRVQLHWTDHARVASGYRVFRSTDDGAFKLAATLRGARASAFADVSVAAGHTYAYEVQAYYGKRFSAYDDPAVVAIPPIAPSAPSRLTAAVTGGSSVTLGWSAPAGMVDGYLVLRSDDAVHFTQVAQIASSGATADVDATAASGQNYWYKVEAYNSGGTSVASNTASASVPQEKASPDVTIATRFGDELVVTVSGAGSDFVTLSQSGPMLTVDADGDVYTESVSAAGVFVYTRGGNKEVTVAASVSVRTTIETIDNATTTITSAGSNVSAWIDSTDVFGGTGTVHRVSSFAGGVSKATGASLPDPSDAGTTTKPNLSLWGTGPVATDVNQGGVGDCYFLSSLAAFAGGKPSVLTESAVDMGDGTYVVQFQSAHATTFVRVNGDLSTGPFGGYMFAHPGANDTIWAMVMEKAFAYFRTGDNTYASISGGWMGEVYADLGVRSADLVPGAFGETAFYTLIAGDLAHGQAVTLGTSDSSPDLISDHAYTLVSASVDRSGVTHYVVRNPWGFAGDGLENAQGYATLTFAQLTANFEFGCQATT